MVSQNHNNDGDGAARTTTTPMHVRTIISKLVGVVSNTVILRSRIVSLRSAPLRIISVVPETSVAPEEKAM